jgi:hypothetical protein
VVLVHPGLDDRQDLRGDRAVEDVVGLVIRELIQAGGDFSLDVNVGHLRGGPNRSVHSQRREAVQDA